MAIAILVTGSRRWTDRGAIAARLKQYARRKEVVVINGGATGADELATQIAKERQWEVRIYPARWRRHGPRRSELMLQTLVDYRRVGWDTVVEAFPEEGSRGTRHMITIATEQRFKVNINQGDETHGGT